MGKAQTTLILLSLLVITLTLKSSHNLESSDQQDLAYYDALTQK